MLLRIKFVLLTLNLVNSARILAVFPTPSISHQVVFTPLTEELARRGHDVVVITTDPVKNPKSNVTEIDVHDFSYKMWTEFYKTTASGNTGSLADQLRVALDLITEILIKQIQVEDVQKMIREDTFDLILIEAWVRPALIFSHFFKAPVISVSSFLGFYGNYETVGAPIHPLLYPIMTRQKMNNLSMMDKVTEMYNYYLNYYAFLKHEEFENSELRKNFGSDIPRLSELNRNVVMLFLNSHPIWDSNRPVPPSVVYMGGLHQKPVKELPKDLKTYLDTSKNGVIYISFGTNVSPSSLPPERIQTMAKVFSQLPYDVIWKWDKETLPGKSSNIRIEKWLPQSDLLRHPKVKLFITQGGLQSTDEAITAGVPLVGIPMLGDQWYNVERYVQLNIGVRLDLESLTEESFKNALETILRDPSYRENIVKLGILMHDQPQSPLQRAVWWTEHVLRHGGAKHLRAPAANMSWAEYLEIELVGILLGAMLVLVVIVVAVIFSIWKYTKYYSQSETNYSKRKES